MEAPSSYKSAPFLIYGTAFKDEDTASLVLSALKAGFRAIDTSGNKPQYREALVGQGIAAAIEAGLVPRSDLYVQTKFSPYKASRDPAFYPYDVSRSISEQVQESVSSSLANLGVDYIDCLVLHSLYPQFEDSITAWRAMEALVPSRVLSLGLSNADAKSLREIWEAASVKPISVQNRFTGEIACQPESNLPPGLPYPQIPYDRDVRKVCEILGIVYVPWGLLWGNAHILGNDPEQMVAKTATSLGVSQQAAWYACIRDLNNCRTSVLCGTTKEATMRKTLADLAKLDDCVKRSESDRVLWITCVDYIRHMINSF